ncbi:MAG: class I SAM-dependent methyltransferase [Gaiellales bacterium]
MPEPKPAFGPLRSSAVMRARWNRRYRERELGWSVDPNPLLVAEASDLPAGRCLDLACGEGRSAIWLAQRGWRVTAVDFSDTGLERARLRAAHHGVEVEWVLQDVLDYEPRRHAYGLVLALYLQLPPRERRFVLAGACRAVAPGGRVLVVGHDLENLEHGWRGPSDPDVLLTAADVAAELPGLVIDRAERLTRSLDVDGETRDAFDALVRAHRRS